ncbi:putative bifunctional diguanylate cyclase/phosphodiesterase [Nodosilinea sp. PGN35]|uniref:putative bifunctional diguanylate cyclase/phosphodiesterase n=1 Tax=Nodosilinea sp. PGN35 TaxID=3020489 RepID=UPI0023B2BC6C|nr:EAL domain-containing protein [Nodosilinea sp. TSF1-S3]MDF0366752.1 EAL domain-containing protein [Nodosilinea sp. TSF1-S3]
MTAAEPLRALIVEDSDNDLVLLLRELRRAGFAPVWRQVQTADDFRLALEAETWDVVLSDYQLPQFDAPAALELLLQCSYDLPFIVVSGTVGEATAVDMMRAGAHDYVMKDNLSRLAEAVRREVREAHSRRDRRQAQAELERTRELLHLAIDGSGIGIWDWQVQTGEVWASDRCAGLIGYDSGNLGPARIDTWQRFVHPDDWSRKKVALQRHFTGQTATYDCEFRLRHRLGHWVWVLDRGKVVEWDAAHHPVRMSGTYTDITERRLAEAEHRRIADQMLFNSLHDALTQLPNRNFLMQRLDLTLQRCRRGSLRQFAVLFLDLDHFKVINDSLGHLAGDEVLVVVAQKLRSLVRATDLAARLGGDEFVLLLEDIDTLQEPLRIAKRLLQELQEPLAVGGSNVFLNASLGIVMGMGDYTTPTEPLRDADIAMYQAKAQGRGRYVVFNESMHLQALQRLQLEQELRDAIGQGELVLYYQPIFHLETKEISGFEALVRWQHPDRGFISPDSFIPIAEETGLVVALDRWVLTQATQQLARWHQRYPHRADLTVSINFSVKDLLRTDLLSDLADILTQTGLQGRHLNLEITESTLIEDIQAMVKILQQLKHQGFTVTIDDFGTGYSSLSYLHQLPVDALKIDRSFVMAMEASRRNSDIVETIITLSNRLGLAAIAEGVETQAQLCHLHRLGCELGQGYWFARPLPAAEAETLLNAAPTSAAARR